MSAVEPQKTYASFQSITNAIRAFDTDKQRVLVGIAGPPGAGKSTFASQLARQLGPQAAVLPMDGFHFDNARLLRTGMLDRKGAPETFDSVGFVHLVKCLHHQDDVTYPTFDRKADRTIPNGGCVHRDKRVVLIEGNYLLLQEPPWSELKAHLDLTIYLDVSRAQLRSRLMTRWREQGLSESHAESRVEQNDMINAERVCSSSQHADFVIGEDSQLHQ